MSIRSLTITWMVTFTEIVKRGKKRDLERKFISLKYQ